VAHQPHGRHRLERGTNDLKSVLTKKRERPMVEGQGVEDP